MRRPWLQRLAELCRRGIEAGPKIANHIVSRPYRLLCFGKTRLGDRETLTQIIASRRIVGRVMIRVVIDRREHTMQFGWVNPKRARVITVR